MFNDGFFYNQSGQTAVSFHYFHNRGHFDQLTQTFPAVFRHSQLFLQLLIYFFDSWIIGIRHFNQFSAILFQQMQDISPDCALRTGFPIIPMHNIIRMQLCNDIVIHDFILNNDIFNSIQRLINADALFQGDGRKFVITNQCFIA